jgi:hypothetical protein
MVSIDSADGPIKINPAAFTFLAKSAFSLKKPYPGWIASAPVCLATSIILSPNK